MIDEAILNAMHRSFGNSVRRVWMPRAQRFFTFREPNVGEQKTFSRIVLANSDSQSTVYGATLSLIRRLALDKDFAQYGMDEMERLVILANLFSTNFLTKQISVTCPNEGCNNQFIHSIKHGELLKGLEKIDASDIVYEDTNDIGHVKVQINYPSTKKYLAFLEYLEEQDAISADESKKTKDAVGEQDKYEKLDHAFDELSSNTTSPMATASKRDNEIAEFIEKRKTALKDGMKKSKAAGNVDLRSINAQFAGLNSVDLYIRKIEWKVNGDENDYSVTFDNSITFEETERILGGFPMAFFTREDGSTLTDFISASLYKRVNATIPQIVCPKCGLDLTSKVNLYDFFMLG